MRHPSRPFCWSLTAACMLGAAVMLGACGPFGSPLIEGTSNDVGPPARGVDTDVATQGGGAGAGSRPATELDARSISNEAVMALARNGTYRKAGYRRVDRSPFVSTVSPDKLIALYISEGGYDAYTAVSPDDVGSGAALPVGTVIVREVWGGGALSAVTLMVQLEKGAFPLGGDFWYASLSPDGEVNHDAQTGEPQLGLTERCGSCHLRCADDGFLFGVPLSSLP